MRKCLQIEQCRVSIITEISIGQSYSTLKYRERERQREREKERERMQERY
jgi:hypothetical protein